jgi:hypothetical protein
MTEEATSHQRNTEDEILDAFKVRIFNVIVYALILTVRVCVFCVSVLN